MENAGQRFITAFNEIEKHFRAELGDKKRLGFAELARRYVVAKDLPVQHQTALLAFARLRNAISHELYRDGLPVADPRLDIVEQIEQLRNLYLTPRTVMSILEPREVCSVDPSQPISAALEYVRLFDYSQIPVYDGDHYVGILTTNATARWLAAQLAADAGLLKAETVGHILKFTEEYERAQHVPPSITAVEAVRRLSKGGVEGKPLTALIITKSGSPTEKPLRVVSDYDLPALVSELAIR